MVAVGKECLCQSFDQLLLTVKPEAVYSDDSAPAVADAVLFTQNPTITIVAESIERDIATPNWGNNMKDFVNKFVQIDGTTELMGAGVAGDLPNISALLRSAGMAETQSIGVDVTYDPASENIPSNSIYFYHGLDLWKVVGCRADMTLNMGTGFPVINWRIMGLFTEPESNAVIPTPTFSAVAKPLVMSYENTPAASFFGQAIDLESLTFTTGNKLSPRDVPGCYSVQITDRAPSGTLVTCAPDLSDINYYQKAASLETGALALTHGKDAGLINEVAIPACQIDLSGITTTEITENKKGISLPFMPLPVAGDDDFQLTFK